MDLTALTDPDLDQLRVDVLNEQERRRILTDSPALVDQIAARYAAATADTTPTPWADLTDRVGPGQRIVWTDGETWRNASGAWLPTTATPATWPQGWAQETGLPPDVAPWVAGESVVIADLREYEGTVYLCIQAHTTQSGWTPTAVPALWTPQG